MNTKTAPTEKDDSSEQRAWVAMALSCLGFIGLSGMQRLYVGRIWSALLQLITLGGLGVWQVVDMVNIILGRFTDEDQLRLEWGKRDEEAKP